jgi:glycosyltransferase involved in cell wall biosynthesis
MKEPLISVIIPTYNYGQFIRSALESLYRQTYHRDRIEVIVVDDGSTDDTEEILNTYEDRLIYLRQENRGIASARNRGISTAKGELITFLDSDDLWHEERLRRVVEAFSEDQGIGIVYHPVELIDREGDRIHQNFYAAFGYKEGLSGWITNGILSGEIFCGGSSFTFKKEIMDHVQPIPEDMKRGIDFYLAALTSCRAPAAYIHDVLGKYRLHGQNTTMLAGQKEKDNRELASVNRDFAYTRQKTMEKMLSLRPSHLRAVDINILERMKAKELIFYCILEGRRMNAVREIPSLFKGNPSGRELMKGCAVSMMALLVPSFLYPRLVRGYGVFLRMKNFVR